MTAPKQTIVLQRNLMGSYVVVELINRIQPHINSDLSEKEVQKLLDDERNTTIRIKR